MKKLLAVILVALSFTNAQAQLTKEEKKLMEYIDANMPRAIELLKESVNVNSGTLNIEGVKKVSGLDNMRFRYFKSFKSHPATLEELETIVPTDKNTYNIATEKNSLDNFSNFFSNSYAENLNVVDESITFKRAYSGPVSFDIVASGAKQDIYNNIKGPIVLESKDMAEVMFLTKVIGNYNITKISDTFIFENKNWAVALKRK